MKKYLLGGVFLCLAIILTGCAEDTKTMVCTKTQSGVDIELTIKFIGEKIDNMGIKYTMDLKDYEDIAVEEIKKQDFCEIVSQNLELDNSLIDCKQDITDKTLLLTGNEDIDEKNKEINPAKAKEMREGQGYTCVIK